MLSGTSQPQSYFTGVGVDIHQFRALFYFVHMCAQSTYAPRALCSFPNHKCHLVQQWSRIDFYSTSPITQERTLHLQNQQQWNTTYQFFWRFIPRIITPIGRRMLLLPLKEGNSQVLFALVTLPLPQRNQTKPNQKVWQSSESFWESIWLYKWKHSCRQFTAKPS